MPRKITPEDALKSTFVALGEVVRRASKCSATDGLEITAMAFSALLDVYAKPNANNPAGMCDDPRAFRQYFADIIAGGTEGVSADAE